MIEMIWVWNWHGGKNNRIDREYKQTILKESFSSHLSIYSSPLFLKACLWTSISCRLVSIPHVPHAPWITCCESCAFHDPPHTHTHIIWLPLISEWEPPHGPEGLGHALVQFGRITVAPWVSHQLTPTATLSRCCTAIPPTLSFKATAHGAFTATSAPIHPSQLKRHKNTRGKMGRTFIWGKQRGWNWIPKLQRPQRRSPVFKPGQWYSLIDPVLLTSLQKCACEWLINWHYRLLTGKSTSKIQNCLYKSSEVRHRSKRPSEKQIGSIL